MLRKRITGVAVASAMAFTFVGGIVPGTAPVEDVAAAAQYEMFGHHNFAGDKGLPFHTAVTPPAELEFDILGSEGIYKILMVNPGGAARGGESRWDAQFRHRGLTIRRSGSYHISFEVRASNSGEMKVKVGNTDGDEEYWHDPGTGEWGMLPVPANQWVSVSQAWTPRTSGSNSMTVDMNTSGEFAFHFGGAGEYQDRDCFPPGTVIEFRNLSLKTSIYEDRWIDPEPYIRKEIQVNQLGYYPLLRKVATMSVSNETDVYLNGKTRDTAFSSAMPFELRRNGTAVQTFTSTPLTDKDFDSGEYVHHLDFSTWQEPGTYTLWCNGKESHPFSIGDNVYAGLLADSFNYFYHNRAGIQLSAQYMTDKDTANNSHLATRQTAHANENPARVSWYNETSFGTTRGFTAPNTGESSLSIVKGWYDAGDYGKYVVNGGISAWTIQNAYEMELAKSNDNSDFSPVFTAIGDWSIPERASNNPDLLEEARWQMDFMLSMQVKSGSFAGMAYHKISDEKWTMLAMHPGEYPEATPNRRVIKPPSTAATLNLAATAAQASRLWQPFDAAYASTLITAAEAAYAAALANPTVYAPMDDNVGGGPYGDDDVSDEFAWAAAELFITTGKDTYSTEMRKYANKKGTNHFLTVHKTIEGGENFIGTDIEGTYTSFNWGNVGTLGSISLLLNPSSLTAAEQATLIANFQNTADDYIATMDRQGYGLPYKAAPMTQLQGTPNTMGYEWGSNSMVISNAMAIAYAYVATGNTKYLSYASTAMDYLLGRNPFDFSYVTGYGSYHLKNPHHRWWAFQDTDTFPKAPAGVLSGGPNSAMQDPWVKGLGFKLGTMPPQVCFTDDIEAWSVNECTINWNSPLVWMVGFMELEAANPGEIIIVTTPAESTAATTAATTAGTTGGNVEPGDWPNPTMKGDVNVDGSVDVADIMQLMMFLSGQMDLSNQAKANANVHEPNVQAITPSDGATILQMLAKVITSWPA